MKKTLNCKIAFLLTLATLFIICSVFAQDSTATGATGAATLPSWVPLVGSLLLGVYELVVRLVPTVKNYSIIGWVIKIIQLIVPNNASADSTVVKHP